MIRESHVCVYVSMVKVWLGHLIKDFHPKRRVQRSEFTLKWTMAITWQERRVGSCLGFISVLSLLQHRGTLDLHGPAESRVLWPDTQWQHRHVWWSCSELV